MIVPESGPVLAQPAGGEGSSVDAAPDEFDIVATYHRLLAEDADLTRPIAAIEALIEVLRHTPSSTAMETYEISETQVLRLHAAVPNSLPIEAGTRMFTGFLSMSMRQPSAAPINMTASTTSSIGGLDSFDKIRQHLLDNSQLFVQRAKEARHRIADRGCRLVESGHVVLTAGGSRAVQALLLKAAERLTARQSGLPAASPDEWPFPTAPEPTSAPFTVLYVVDERSRQESERHMTVLRSHHIPVIEIDPSAVAYALEAYAVRSVFVGAEAVTHDGKVVSRIGTFQLAVLADAAKPKRNFFVLVETHKFVRKLLLNNRDLSRINVQQAFFAPDGSSPRPVPARVASQPPAKPLLPFCSQVDVTPPTLVTNFITENGIIQPSGSYRIVAY
ncbi:translation initiation factor eif-2b alpha [Grosmannia clavigera kw1407]|uniref:Translation initiation factor eIF2B subunit alpha n=1 Tax=Grosmannia clavigera (strain kw1407 / UAMH 11150) TaxID=655863 RepID=F0XFG9_GROCL|nr:translation initiation factor eif-2b alpha [Grosmannia clavigera kw1407]EFX04617.1 translation initiation factor eif-2b alpha [Grosmannia clavigera kw1407]